jgi:hypothetical protein
MNDSWTTPPALAPIAALDLDQVESLASAEHQLRHPVSGDPVGAWLTLAGPEHPDRRRLVHKALLQHRDEYERTGKVGLAPDEAEAQALALVIGCTLGWRGMVTGGAALEYSVEACRALYSDPRRAWVRDQAKAALDRRDLFIGASPSA